MNIKCRLKVILAERGIKSGWLSDQVGVGKSTISLLINNKSLPTIEVAYKIAEVLNLPVEAIWVKEDQKDVK